MQLYTNIDGYNERDARLTAETAAVGWYRKTDRGYAKRRVTGMRKMPRPGNLLNLGCFIELEYVSSDGTIYALTFSPQDKIPLFWSDDKQALFVFPYDRPGACVYPPEEREDRLSRIWAKGRPAECASDLNFPAGIPLPVAYPAIQVSYRSDKFSRSKSITNYIHHHERSVPLLGQSQPGPVVYFSKEPYGAKTPPRAIMIAGGKLSLTTHGIDG